MGKGVSARPGNVLRDLSHTQLKVLRGWSEGMRDQEIADLDGRSLETVKSQAKFVRQKLGAKTRANAVAIGFREGILL
jgi:DNA-binding CsgD family transcriptional regulator